MSSLNNVNRTKYITFSTIETDYLLMNNSLLIFTSRKYTEMHSAPVIPFTFLRLSGFATIHVRVYQH